MTKTPTEQWREGTLEEGWYYVFYADQSDHYISCDTENYDGIDYWNGCEWHFDDDPVIKVLAPVPSYDEYLYLKTNNDHRNKEAIRISKQAIGIVLESDELVQKMHILEKRLEVSEKEHYRTLEQLRIATGALRKYANCKPTEWMSCVTADKALKEMEGVK